MKYLLVLISIIVSSFAFSQEEKDVPFIGYFGGYGNYKVLKNDSAGSTFIPNADTNHIFFISKKYADYRMYDRKNNLIVKGDIGGRVYVDYFKRFGEWTAYYPSGKPRVIGNYFADQPIGTWQYFYPNGQLKRTYILAWIESDSMNFSCKVGPYEEYYENGQLKLNGFYKVVSIDTAIQIIDSITGRFKDALIHGPVSRPYGTWKHYKENGELEKKEEYY